MYHFSRSIYRELAPDILEDRPDARRSDQPRARPARLRGARRAARHRPALLRPADADAVQRHPDLLPDVRPAARLQRRRPLHDVRREYFASQPGSTGSRLECRATTREGTPCQRMPLPHNGYCPSHQHLAETEETSRDRRLTYRASVPPPDAAGRRRRRDLHRRRARRRRPAGHREGADDAGGPVRGRAGRRRGRARARRAPTRGDVEAFAHGTTVGDQRAARGRGRAHGARRHRGLRGRRRARPPGARRPLPAVRGAPGAARAARAARRRAPSG